MPVYRNSRFGDLFREYTSKIGDVKQLTVYLSGKIPVIDSMIGRLISGLRGGNLLGNIHHTSDGGAPLHYYALRLFNLLNVLEVQGDSEMITIIRKEFDYKGGYPPTEPFPVIGRGYVSPRSKARAQANEARKIRRTLVNKLLALPEDKRKEVETFIDSL